MPKTLIDILKERYEGEKVNIHSLNHDPVHGKIRDIRESREQNSIHIIIETENDIKSIDIHPSETTIEIVDQNKNDKDVSKPMLGSKIPYDLFDAVTRLNELSIADKIEWLAMRENKATALAHHELGRTIRNEWKLWTDESPLVKYMKALSIDHPDEMSDLILTAFHRYANGKDPKIGELIEEKQKNCKEMNENEK
ncbi:MAG: DUF6794 domain-containing protein [bacterium]